MVKVTGKGYGRVAVAGLVCARPGRRTRLIYRTMVRREPRGFTARDFARLADAAHAQLGGKIVLVWDNDRRHLSRVMREAIRSLQPAEATPLFGSSSSRQRHRVIRLPAGCIRRRQVLGLRGGY